MKINIAICATLGLSSTMGGLMCQNVTVVNALKGEKKCTVWVGYYSDLPACKTYRRVVQPGTESVIHNKGCIIKDMHIYEDDYKSVGDAKKAKKRGWKYTKRFPAGAFTITVSDDGVFGEFNADGQMSGLALAAAPREFTGEKPGFLGALCPSCGD